uniref:Uncharacterized protein n=1 Tax=Romanomermis culicivorax TaxID=13658 RepID=A0A915IM36_ROMCU
MRFEAESRERKFVHLRIHNEYKFERQSTKEIGRKLVGAIFTKIRRQFGEQIENFV